MSPNSGPPTLHSSLHTCRWSWMQSAPSLPGSRDCAPPLGSSARSPRSTRPRPGSFSAWPVPRWWSWSWGRWWWWWWSLPRCKWGGGRRERRGREFQPAPWLSSLAVLWGCNKLDQVTSRFCKEMKLTRKGFLEQDPPCTTPQFERQHLENLVSAGSQCTATGQQTGQGRTPL